PIYNVGRGEGSTVREIMTAVRQGTGVGFEPIVAPRRPGDPARIVAACERARSLLGWQPQLDDLATIVGHALAWERKLRARSR
ncbi:MAG: UDP-glucose 4-epimerase GalE, partial [Xanthobacteraceae bacterium]